MSQRARTIPMSVEAIERFRDFLELTVDQTYPEAPSEPHHSISRIMMERVLTSCAIAKPGRILDVGCGQGPALDLLRNEGYHAVGITINDEDIRVCREHGHEVYKMDQSFLEFPPEEFDLVWSRHCLEHSVMPFVTLHGFRRVLREDGFLYLEVPAPDTASHHESNVNHYSTLPKSAWMSLLNRCGFKVMWSNEFEFTPPVGPDTYYMFVCQKSGVANE